MRAVLGIFILVFSLSASEVYATLNIEALKSADLAFSSSGIVKSVKVDVGAKVKKGDILATLINDDLKAMLNISKTSLKYASSEYKRQLKIRHLIDAGKFEQYAFKYENEKNQVKYRESLLDKTILRAPFDGVIAEKDVECGDVVSGQMIRTLFKINSQQRQKLILQFDQAYWKSVKVGQTFRYKIDGDTNSYEGIITKIYPYTNSVSRKIKAEIIVKGFLVGLFGDGVIIIDDNK